MRPSKGKESTAKAPAAEVALEAKGSGGDGDPAGETPDISPAVASPGTSPAPRIRKVHRDHIYLDERYGFWVAEYRDAQGRRRRRRAARTFEAAKAVRRKWLDEVDQQKAGGRLPVKDMTVRRFSVEFNEWATAHKRPMTARRYETSLVALLPHFGHRLLGAVTTKGIEKFMAERLQEGCMPGTVNRDVAALKKLFNKAIERGYAVDNPVRRVEFLEENNARVRFLSDEERKALLAECHGTLLDVVMVALYTGTRLMEILNLRWTDVDFARRQIAVRESKNGEPRFVPMPQTLLDHMKGIQRLVGCPHVFVDREGEQVTSIRSPWLLALKRAKIEDFRFHDLRHSFASYYMMAGGNEHALRKILGHKTLTMTNRYAHLAPGHLHAGVDEMARRVADGTLFPKEEGGPVAARDREAV